LNGRRIGRRRLLGVTIGIGYDLSLFFLRSCRDSIFPQDRLHAILVTTTVAAVILIFLIWYLRRKIGRPIASLETKHAISVPPVIASSSPRRRAFLVVHERASFSPLSVLNSSIRKASLLLPFDLISLGGLK